MSRFGSAASNTLVLGLRDADVWGLHAYPLWIVTILDLPDCFVSVADADR